MLIGKHFKEFQTIDSTNSFIKRNIKTLPNGYLAFSTNQTAGYGNLGRVWANFKNENLAISVLFKHINNNFLKIATKLACVCTLKSLNELGITKVQIKWFNDLQISDKKIAGALGEAQIYGNEIHCVLGLGINLLQTQNSFKICNLPHAGSVFSQTNKTIQPKIFLKHYLKNLNFFVNNLEINYLKTINSIQKIYLDNCCTLGHHLKIINNLNNTTFFGIAKRILNNGNLLVETNNQLIELYPSKFSIFTVY